MIRRLLLGAAAFAALETTAHACSCEDPASLSPEAQEESARWIAEQKFIIAEVVRLRGSQPQVPERYRVLRRIVGQPPDEIVVQRHVTYLPDGKTVVSPVTSCDYSGAPGQRLIMAFTERGAAAPCAVLSRLSGTTVRAAGMCTQFAVQNAAILSHVERLSRVASRP